MILTDAGPMVALVNRRDPNHQTCVQASIQLPNGPMVTTWPCFTEAMHILGRAVGYNGQEQLWNLVWSRDIEIAAVPDHALNRMADLMGKYRDLPMDLADASLVVLAELRRLPMVFSLDGDFRIYRLQDGSALEVIP